MNQIRSLFAVIFFLSFAVSFAQNDCSDALVVCGNTGFDGLSATGVGTQELSGSNTCDSEENNSIWLKIVINQGGTLGFVLTPQSSAIEIDFDFFVLDLMLRVAISVKLFVAALLIRKLQVLQTILQV